MLSALNMSQASIAPKRMRFDENEWICLKPEEYALIMHRIHFDEIFIKMVRIKEPDFDKLFNEACTGEFVEPIQVSEASEKPSNFRKDEPHIDSRFITEAENVLGNSNEKYVPLDEIVQGIAVGELKKARRQKKLSQKRLAEMAGLTQPQISNLEKESASVSVQTLKKIANALGIKIFI